MSMAHKCDCCGKATKLNPPVEYVFKKGEKKIEVPEVDKDGKQTGKMVEHVIEVPEYEQTIRRSQDPLSGKVVDQEVPTVKDLEERAFLVNLSVGGEYVHRDFCRECLDKEILPVLKPLFDKLASFDPKR